MLNLLFRLLFPYLQRYLANRAAIYLQERRTRRLKKLAENIATTDPLLIGLSKILRGRSSNTLWFSLAGLLLGSAFGAIFYLLVRDSNARGLG
jgi:hypothetical protein